MAQNIEIKASASNFSRQELAARALSDTALEVINQVDTFFKVEKGRLKLRELVNAPSQLIFYQRLDQSGPKLSEYFISETEAPDDLKTVLTKAYGIEATVSKTRHLYITGRTRIHFDRVDNLGEFIELEVVLGDADSLDDGEQEANELMNKLDIRSQDLIENAYVDLLRNQKPPE